MRHLIVAPQSLELAGAEAEQMATLDMPDESSGVAADSFVRSADARPTRKKVASDAVGGAKPKRRKKRRTAAAEQAKAATAEKLSHSDKASAMPAVMTDDRSEKPDTQSVAEGETFAGTQKLSLADSLRMKFAAISRQQRGIAVAAGVLLVAVLVFALRPDSTSLEPKLADEGTIICESSRPRKIVGSEDDLPSKSNEVFDLFDGKSLDGWESEGGSDWTVQNGILTGRGSTLLVYTEEEFKDVRVTVECKVPSGSHSGLFLRHAFGSGWGNGYEAQISSDHCQASMTGGITNLQSVNAQLVPHNVWFTLD